MVAESHAVHHRPHALLWLRVLVMDKCRPADSCADVELRTARSGPPCWLGSEPGVDVVASRMEPCVAACTWK
jgi:hypothetical protein